MEPQNIGDMQNQKSEEFSRVDLSQKRGEEYEDAKAKLFEDGNPVSNVVGKGSHTTGIENIMSNLSISGKTILNESEQNKKQVRLTETNRIEILDTRTYLKKSADYLHDISPQPWSKGSASHPRKKLLILDINGFLADVVSPLPKGYKADITIARRAIFNRPYYLDFMKFCLNKFEVAIWSSRNKRNVELVVNYLIGDMKDKLLFCWDSSHCTLSKFKTLENRYKPLVFKDLRKVWERDDLSHSREGTIYNECNTLLVDDSPYKALLNPPHTAIFPYSFRYFDKNDDLLGPGGAIRVYLEKVAAAENVQKYVEQNPFGQGAIIEGSHDWNFYFRAMNSVTR